MLDAKALYVTAARKDILQGVDLSAEPGALTAIVGPNGSGKTTTLKALTGEVPFRGKIVLNGHDITELKPWDLAAIRGVLPQASALAFPFTVGEVVRIGLEGGAEGDVADRIPQALAKVGMQRFAGRLYQELSGGEQQRVQLARVLAQIWHPVLDGKPRWLFLDEPVASLDIAHQLTVMNIARDFARGGGGVIAVMHDLNLTALYADSVAILSEGKLLAQGAPADIFTNETLSQAYGCQVRVGVPPDPGQVYILPQAAALH